MHVSADTRENCDPDGEGLSFQRLINCSPAVPRPKMAEGASKRRKVAHAEIITSSPYKQSLMATGPRPRSASKTEKKPPKTKRVRVKKVAVKELRLKTPCYKCGVDFGDASDHKRNEDWIQCKPCGEWFHESCGEEFGILDDDTFTCQGCF